MAAPASRTPSDWLLDLLDPLTSLCLRAQAEERVPRLLAWPVNRYVRWYSPSDNVSARPLCAGNWLPPQGGNP